MMLLVIVDHIDGIWVVRSTYYGFMLCVGLKLLVLMEVRDSPYVSPIGLGIRIWKVLCLVDHHAWLGYLS